MAGVRWFCLTLAAVLGVASGKALLEPAQGSYFGVSIDFQTTTVQQYLNTAGIQPVIFNVFISLPLNSTIVNYMQQTIPQVAAQKGVVLLSIEPDKGLAAVDAAAVTELAGYIAQYEKAGASFMIRYGHEMNGNWYAWGQQPTEYIASHKLVAGILRNSTCGVAMVWAPNSAEGYPWQAGTSGQAIAPVPTAGSANFKAMDTNGDGKIDASDDPYLPFYPGDALVDWVGMSSFHFGGTSYPYTLNQQAAANAFTKGFTGEGNANFYGRFSGDGVHNKPMVITETSAMYNPSNPSGQTNFAIKSDWWQQVFNVQGSTATAKDMSVDFPRIKAIMWFDEIKSENQAARAVIDWRFSGNQQIQNGLAMYIAQPAKSTGKKYWLQLSDFTSSSDGFTCGANGASTTAASTTSANTTTPAAATTIASTAKTPPVTSSTSTFASTTPTSLSPPVSTGQSLASLIGKRRLH